MKMLRAKLLTVIADAPPEIEDFELLADDVVLIC